MEAVGFGERRPLPEPQAQAERGVADRAGDVEPVAGRGRRRAPRMRPGSTAPIAVIASVSGPGVLTVSPPISGQP